MHQPIRVIDVKQAYEEYRYRTPIKFGGVALDQVTILNVKVIVEDERGKRATGYGSMPLGNVWAFPSKKMNYSETLATMRNVGDACAKIAGKSQYQGHPI